MLLPEGAVTCHASRGRYTLQCPQYGDDNGKTPMVEYPDEWFIELTVNNTPVVGKQQGYIHLSPAGWKANKEAIKAAFMAKGVSRQCTWEKFEERAQAFFGDIHTKALRAIKKREKEIARLQQLLKLLEGDS